MIHEIDQEALDKAAHSTYKGVTIEAYRVLRATAERVVEAYMDALPEPVPLLPPPRVDPAVRRARLERLPSSGSKAYHALHAVVRSSVGLTAYELGGYTMQPRLAELAKGGWVAITDTRPGPNGKPLSVYSATEKAMREHRRGAI